MTFILGIKKHPLGNQFYICPARTLLFVRTFYRVDDFIVIENGYCTVYFIVFVVSGCPFFKELFCCLFRKKLDKPYNAENATFFGIVKKVCLPFEPCKVKMSILRFLGSKNALFMGENALFLPFFH